MPDRSSVARSVWVHPSRWPDAVLAARRTQIQAGVLPSEFLYDSAGASARWLAVHEAHSPTRTEASVQRIYPQLMDDLRSHRPPETWVSLGCGGGQKDRAVLQALRGAPLTRVLAVDSSLWLALRSQDALKSFGASEAWVVDLEGRVAPEALGIGPEESTWVTAFGLAPNFEPEHFATLLRAFAAPDRPVLLSVNASAEGPGSPSGARILSQYDNEETRAWIGGGLFELGLPKDGFELEFTLEETGPYTWQVQVWAHLKAPVFVNGFGPEPLHVPSPFRALVSNRVQVGGLPAWVESQGLEMGPFRVSASQEEAVMAVWGRAR